MMQSRTLFRVVLFCSLFLLVSSAIPLGKKTKLCGDETCSEVLFKEKFREILPKLYEHPQFLHPQVEDVVSVYAFMFSDRADLMEGALLREPQRKGNFYYSHIHTDGYVKFLKDAILSNKTLFMICTDPQDTSYNKAVGLTPALPGLLMTYKAISKKHSVDNNLPPPEELDLEKLGYKPEVKGHGHSHGGHGHSHDSHTHSHNEVHNHAHSSEEGNVHSHDEAHGHSHGVGEGHGHSHGGVEAHPAGDKVVVTAQNSVPSDPSSQQTNIPPPKDPPSGQVTAQPLTASPPTPESHPIDTDLEKYIKEKEGATQTSDNSDSGSDVPSVDPTASSSSATVPEISNSDSLKASNSVETSSVNVLQTTVATPNQPSENTVQQPTLKIVAPTVEQTSHQAPNVVEFPAEDVIMGDVHLDALSSSSPSQPLNVTLSSVIPGMEVDASPLTGTPPSVTLGSYLTVSPVVTPAPIQTGQGIESTPPPLAHEVPSADVVSQATTVAPIQQPKIIAEQPPLKDAKSSVEQKPQQEADTIKSATEGGTGAGISVASPSESLEPLTASTTPSATPVTSQENQPSLEKVDVPTVPVTPPPVIVATPLSTPETAKITKSSQEQEAGRVENIAATVPAAADQHSAATAVPPVISEQTSTQSPSDTMVAPPTATEEKIPEDPVPPRVEPSPSAAPDREAAVKNMGTEEASAAQQAVSTPETSPSSEKEEVRTEIMEEDGLGYCIKGDCDKKYVEPVASQSDLPSPPPQGQNWKKPEHNISSQSGFGKVLSKIIGIFRYALPSPVAGIDDAGVVVTLLVPLFLVIHMIRILLFSDSSEQEAFDRRYLHDALTAVRERDEQIKILRADAEKTKGLANRGLEDKIEQLKLDIGQGRLEVQQLKTKCSLLEDDNERLKKEAEESRSVAHTERQKVAKLSDENKQLERNNVMLSDQISEIQSAMENAREKSERLENELADKNALIARQETEARAYSLEVKKLEVELKTSKSEGAMLKERVEALQNESAQLSEMLEEMGRNQAAMEQKLAVEVQPQEDHGAHESGGSGGWSDIGDFDVDSPVAEDKKLPTIEEKNQKVLPSLAEKDQKGTMVAKTHSADIMEVARLRAQLKRIEADLEQAKLALQKEENMREHLTRKVELAELEASERKKETEAKEAERVDTHNQCKKMLAMVEERDAKIRHTEEITERLRDEVSKWQAEVRHLEEQKKAVESKLNETEQELKKLRAENNRLETRHFHEMRECRQTINNLQQSLEAAQISAAAPLSHSDSPNLLSLSGNSSSDRDYSGSLAPHLGAPPAPLIRPLWGDDDPPEMFSAGESSLMTSTGGLRGRTTSPEEMTGPLKKSSRSRRSHREHRDASPDAALPRPKKEGRRMRSRSHGRQPVAMPTGYMNPLGIPPSYVDVYNEPQLLNKRNSKSGNLYYSSGGSNGGLSPPPEMALLSGVPPPGLMIKKPTANPRPKSVTEQITRHQN